MSELRVPMKDDSGEMVKAMFTTFLKSYRYSGAVEGELSAQQKLMLNYMDQISAMMTNGKSTVYVNFAHLTEVDVELAEALELEFYRFEPFLRQALQEVVYAMDPEYVLSPHTGQRELFVSFYNFPRIERIRAMGTEKIGRLISISGTVTRSSEVRPELMFGSFICRKCSSVHPAVEQQFAYTEPQICKNPQCKTAGDFAIMLDKCAFVDWQRLRVQENADEIPPGSMPRCVDVICRNEIVELAKAGDKVILTGTVAVIPDTSGLARVGESTVSGKTSGRGESQFGEGYSGLAKLGVKEMTYKILFVASSVEHTEQRSGQAVRDSSLHSTFVIPTASTDSPEEDGETTDATLNMSEAMKADILRMHGEPNLYLKMVESLCPSVYGHDEVKRGVLLMLFGGVHKKTQEGISLRGDLNVCIVGDPSCAKSQFLKYVHGFLPRTVYTSGKSSSAAGLTASVVRDAETGEFCVEAGALMLADNGICCIDEFDKMDPHDQVAIHEAMEQQTISITKAGIQATLNARTSILAAANPVFGRYDRTKTLKANVAVSAAIMSRFDLFFVILDECNPVTDKLIAEHIISVHKEGGLEVAAKKVPFTREQIQRYIQFARNIHPIITPEAKPVLVECYRLLRSNDLLGKNKTAYRITVRQLESLIRLAEALARLHLDDQVRPVYIREAYRLLQKSIIFVETQDIELEDNAEEMDELVYRTLHPSGSSSKRSRRDRDRDSDTGDADMDTGYDHDNAYDEDQAAMEAQEQEQERQALRAVGVHIDGAVKSDKSDKGDKSKGKGPRGDRSEGRTESKDGGDGDDGEDGPEAGAGAAKRPRKSKVTISTADFHQARDLIRLKLQNHEAGQDVTTYEGMLWQDLRDLLLAEFESELTSEEAFEAKKKLLELVMKHMINKEGSIIMSSGSGDNAGKAFLRWSPDKF